MCSAFSAATGTDSQISSRSSERSVQLRDGGAYSIGNVAVGAARAIGFGGDDRLRGGRRDWGRGSDGEGQGSGAPGSFLRRPVLREKRAESAAAREKRAESAAA